MLDTLGFFIQITEENYHHLLALACGFETSRVDKSTGLIEFEFTNFRVLQSYNYRVQWKVDNKHFVRSPEHKSCIEIEGIPYLRVEFSVPKMFYGHNLESVGVEGALEACLLVKKAFENMTGVLLPGPGAWAIYRCDVCANFVLPSPVMVSSYLRYMGKMDFPRRNGHLIKNQTVYFSSRHNTLKIYDKGAEFKVHDAARFVNDIERQRLQNKASRILRCEVELKKRIRYLMEKFEKENNVRLETFKGYPMFDDFLNIVDLNNELSRCLDKFLVGRETRAMHSLDVLKKLNSEFSLIKARGCYAVYMMIVTQGQEETKRQVPKSTYYRVISILRELNISVMCSDIKKDDTFEEISEFEFLDRGFPKDFSLEISETNKYYQMPLAA